MVWAEVECSKLSSHPSHLVYLWTIFPCLQYCPDHGVNIFTNEVETRWSGNSTLLLSHNVPIGGFATAVSHLCIIFPLYQNKVANR